MIKKYKNKFFLLVLIIITFIYSLDNHLLFLIIVAFLLIIALSNKMVTIPIVVIVLLGIRIIIINSSYKRLDNFVTNGVFNIYKVETFDNYQKVYVKNKLGKFYYISKEEGHYSGDKVQLSFSIKLPTDQRTKGSFNQKEYFKHQNIKGILDVTEEKKITHNFSLNFLHEKAYIAILNKYPITYNKILAALVVGEKNNFPQDLKEQISKIGIGHLFVISGLHMEIISKIADFSIDKTKILKKHKSLIILILLLFYYWLSGFMVSILRVLIAFILNKILGKYIKDLSNLDKISLNASIVLLINPLYLFSYSFLLSYSIVFGIIFIQKMLTKEEGFKCYIKNNILISITSIFISLPIVISINQTINFLSIVFNLFFIPLLTYIILPFSFLIIIIPKLGFIYELIIQVFLFLTKQCSNINLFEITLPRLNMITKIIYYILFLILIKQYKIKIKIYAGIIMLIMMTLLSNILVFDIYDNITFIDLPLGDATLIRTHNNLCNVLIDTGKSDDDTLVNYLNCIGIKRIDAVIISHGDDDHIGGLNSLIQHFKIKSIFINYYDNVSINYVKNIKNIKKYYLKKGDLFKLKNFTFEVLWPNNYFKDINNNSLIILANVFSKKILFTGDIEKEAELSFCSIYGMLDFDILKVAHHCSNTSSIDKFLTSMRFKIAVAMNGYNNYFGFPNEEVIKRFASYNITLLNTIENGTITFYKAYNEREFRVKKALKKV